MGKQPASMLWTRSLAWPAARISRSWCVHWVVCNHTNNQIKMWPLLTPLNNKITKAGVITTLTCLHSQHSGSEGPSQGGRKKARQCSRWRLLEADGHQVLEQLHSAVWSAWLQQQGWCGSSCSCRSYSWDSAALWSTWRSAPWTTERTKTGFQSFNYTLGNT